MVSKLRQIAQVISNTSTEWDPRVLNDLKKFAREWGGKQVMVADRVIRPGLFSPPNLKYWSFSSELDAEEFASFADGYDHMTDIKKSGDQYVVVVYPKGESK